MRKTNMNMRTGAGKMAVWVKSNCHSSRGPGFPSQDPCWRAHRHLELQLQGLDALSWPLWAPKKIHINKTNFLSTSLRVNKCS